MFQLLKPVNIDLSSLMGLTDLTDEYEVIDMGNVYEHYSIANIDDDEYKFYYLSGNKLIVEFNDDFYFMKLRYEFTPSTEEEYNEMIESLEVAVLNFEDEHGTTEFKSLTNGQLLYGTEYIKDSIMEDCIDGENDILMNIMQSESGNEYMINCINEGEHYMYIGVPITENEIL